MTAIVGRSASEISRAGANSSWHVASSQNTRTAGSPRLRAASPERVRSCAARSSVFAAERSPSSSPMAQRPTEAPSPQNSSKFAAVNSTTSSSLPLPPRGPLVFSSACSFAICLASQSGPPRLCAMSARKVAIWLKPMGPSDSSYFAPVRSTVLSARSIAPFGQRQSRAGILLNWNCPRAFGLAPATIPKLNAYLKLSANARISGGGEVLSVKSTQLASVSPVAAALKSPSICASLNTCTESTGRDSPADLRAAAMSAVGIAVSGDFPSPYGSTRRAGNSVTPKRAASKAPAGSLALTRPTFA
mmetsp:Transcript_29700/g.74710  ORF Transcript_29700/g.74710 Transcript_29700/m.74710 type:complete len:303 (+) Transcript_29700:894-1802(+)